MSAFHPRPKGRGLSAQLDKKYNTFRHISTGNPFASSIFLPTAFAALTIVVNVTEVFKGSSNRSNWERLVWILLASSPL
jgi:hypothetical protein